MDRRALLLYRRRLVSVLDAPVAGQGTGLATVSFSASAVGECVVEAAGTASITFGAIGISPGEIELSITVSDHAKTEIALSDSARTQLIVSDSLRSPAITISDSVQTELELEESLA